MRDSKVALTDAIAAYLDTKCKELQQNIHSNINYYASFNIRGYRSHIRSELFEILQGIRQYLDISNDYPEKKCNLKFLNHNLRKYVMKLHNEIVKQLFSYFPDEFSYEHSYSVFYRTTNTRLQDLNCINKNIGTFAENSIKELTTCLNKDLEKKSNFTLISKIFRRS